MANNFERVASFDEVSAAEPERESVLVSLEAHYGHQLDSFFHVSLKNSYLYVQTPKVASTTLKRRLIAAEIENTRLRIEEIPLHPDVLSSAHVKPFQLSRGQLVDVLTQKDFFRFCFVRNPYARVLSAYLDKIVKREPEGAAFLARFSIPEWKTIEFADFVSMLVEDDCRKAQWDPHWRPQFALLRPDLIAYDLVGKIETFDEDYVRLRSRIMGLPADVHAVAPHRTNAADKVRENYTRELMASVKRIYANDFAAFDYITDL